MPWILEALQKFIDDLRNCPNRLEYIRRRRTQTVLAVYTSTLSQNELFAPAKEALLEILELDKTYVKDLNNLIKQYF